MSEQPDSCPKCGTPGGPKEFGLQPCTCGWFDYEEAERRRKTAAHEPGVKTAASTRTIAWKGSLLAISLLEPLFTVFVVETLWNWFVVNAFRATTISYWQAMGIALLISLVTRPDTLNDCCLCMALERNVGNPRTVRFD